MSPQHSARLHLHSRNFVIYYDICKKFYFLHDVMSDLVRITSRDANKPQSKILIT